MTNHGCASLHNVHPVNYEHPGFAWGVKGAAASFSCIFLVTEHKDKEGVQTTRKQWVFRNQTPSGPQTRRRDEKGRPALAGSWPSTISPWAPVLFLRPPPLRAPPNHNHVGPVPPRVHQRCAF
jgi:hypothetical protein